MPRLEGEIVLPGFVDLHTHLREPGSNASETIESGTRAAMLGGFVLIGDMPNNPDWPTWSSDRLDEKTDIARRTSNIPITFHSGSQPNSDNIGELAGMAERSMWLKLYGAPTTGNAKDYEASDFRPIITEWHRVAPNLPIGLHAGKDNLEDLIQMVAGEFGHHIHVHHIGTLQQISVVNEAQKRGLSVSSGITPHHIIKSSNDVRSEGWFARMQPPLVDQDQSIRLMRCLADGLIDIIETDHAPHPIHKKMEAEVENPDGIHDEDHTTCFGVPGIELAAKLMFYQVKRGAITMERVVDAMSTRPSEILGVKVSKSSYVTWDMQEYVIGDGNVETGAGWTTYAGKMAVGTIKSLQIQGAPMITNGQIVGYDRRVIRSRGRSI